MLDAFNRRSPLSGRASGESTLRCEGKAVGALFRSLHTHCVLKVDGVRILSLDLDKAVKTLGKERDGQTPLDSLIGVMGTQNTE